MDFVIDTLIMVCPNYTNKPSFKVQCPKITAITAATEKQLPLFIIVVKILTVYSLELEDSDSPVKLSLTGKQPIFNIQINV